MVKICTECYEVNAGGFLCVDCGGRLILTSDPEAKTMPASVWKTQRVDYGARRGMMMRFTGIFMGALLGLYGLRESMALASPWSIMGGILSLCAGLLLWRLFHHAAGRAVRVWVLAKGKVRRGRLIRAIFLSMIPRRGVLFQRKTARRQRATKSA